MNKVITIICDKEIPLKHIFDQNKFEVYETVGRDDLFTLLEKHEPTSEKTT